MKKIAGIFAGILFAVVVVAGQQEEKPVTTTETVSVVNVEVPVRVFLDGKPVDHLKKSDFRLSEGGTPQNIHGFFIKKKSMALPQTASAQPQEAPGRSRYFVLVFRITQFNDQLRQALDFLFENVLSPKDELLVFVNNRNIHLKSFANPKIAREAIVKLIHDEAQTARQRLVEYTQKIEYQLSHFRVDSSLQAGREPSRGIIEFLQKYLRIWKDYKEKFLLPNIDKYYYFSQHLEKIHKDKWVINFYQIEMFPRLKRAGRLMEEIRDMLGILQVSRSEDIAYGQIISSLLQDIDQELQAPTEFPADEISKLFFKTDTTFHSLLIPVNRELLNQDLDYQRIASDLENSMRNITRSTGGRLVFGGDIETSLREVRQLEDVYYVLTYAPSDPGKIGKIKVEVGGGGYRVAFDDQMRADYIQEYLKRKSLEIPEIAIEKMVFKDKTLAFNLTNFLLKQGKKGKIGNINIHITVQDPEGQRLYDQSRAITATQTEARLSVGFPWLKGDRVDIVIHATDLNTGIIAMDFLQPSLAE